MFKQNNTILQLLQEIQRRLKSQQIGFWIDGQDCYLWENTFHYSNKIKVGDLSQTKEKYWVEFNEKLKKVALEHEKRGKFLNTKFSEISDIELIDELKKRTQQQAIKLSMYAGNTSVLIEGQDIKCSGGTCLPIEIKPKENDY